MKNIILILLATLTLIFSFIFLYGLIKLFIIIFITLFLRPLADILAALIMLVIKNNNKKKAIKPKEKYDPADYDYDRENPNALVTGLNISGTVFSSDPDNAPGLGWVI